MNKATRTFSLMTLMIISACLLASASVLAAKPSKPNIVFILVDDLGWADIGAYGSSFYETPNIDNLARSGVMFTDGYAACPVCSPSRGAILSGKYPARTQTTDWFGGNQGGRPGSSVRAGDYKLIEFFEDDSVELYNLRDDLGEKKGLSASMPEKVAELRKRLNAWRAEVDAKMMKPNPAYKQ